jgi:hypothetical protein
MPCYCEAHPENCKPCEVCGYTQIKKSIHITISGIVTSSGYNASGTLYNEGLCSGVYAGELGYYHIFCLLDISESETTIVYGDDNLCWKGTTGRCAFSGGASLNVHRACSSSSSTPDGSASWY